MIVRALEELELLRACWPTLDFAEVGLWDRLTSYPLPRGVWNRETCDVAFQIPAQLPGQAPYGFYARPGLELADGGSIGSYTFPTLEPPFGSGPWGKFSWALAEWRPAAQVGKGSNMVQFARSIADRLREGA